MFIINCSSHSILLQRQKIDKLGHKYVESEKMENLLHANDSQISPRVAVLIPNTINLK